MDRPLSPIAPALGLDDRGSGGARLSSVALAACSRPLERQRFAEVYGVSVVFFLDSAE
jgi:hypothetical protein